MRSVLFCKVILLEEQSQGKNGARLRNQKRRPSPRRKRQRFVHNLGGTTPWDRNTHQQSPPLRATGNKGAIQLPGLTHTEKLL